MWQVITDTSRTSQWAKEFTNGAPFHIVSEWRLASPVIWKDESNATIVEGTVTVIEEPTLLRFTVFAANAPHTTTTSQDGITWTLKADRNATILRVRQGNFASVEGGAKKYKLTELIWARILPRIKQLAEEF